MPPPLLKTRKRTIDAKCYAGMNDYARFFMNHRDRAIFFLRGGRGSAWVALKEGGVPEEEWPSLP